MKIIKKQLLIIFCIVTCMFVLSSCGKNEEEKIPFSYNENELVSCVKNNTETVGNMSEDELDELIAQYDNATDDVSVTLKKGLEEWKRAVKESGKFIKMREKSGLSNEETSETPEGEESGQFDIGNMAYKLKIDGDVIYITCKAECEDRVIDVKYGFGQVDGQTNIVSISYQERYSFKETMIKAGLNTLMGISTVIIVLAFLSIVISCFSIIGKAQKKFEDKKADKGNEVNGVVEQINKNETVIVDETDDTELVTVITAAIAASEQNSTSGFVVRSIRRVGNR